MRVGLVGPLPPPSGGMSNQTRQLANLLGAAGIEVRTAATNAPYRPAWVSGMRGFRAVARLLPYRRRLAALAQQSDVLHVMANSGWAWFLFAVPAIRAGARHGVPTIVNYRGGLAREFLSRHARSIRSTLRAASAVVVPSRFLQQVFRDYGIPATIVPNIVDLERFRPAARQGAHGTHVVVARNLERIYGIDVAIRAAALLRGDFPELVLSIAGSGPERSALEHLAAELGLAEVVRFAGPLEVAEVASLYRAADVALNPSRADNAPNSLLEAAAAGVPIVSTNVGGIPYLVEHGRSAWLVPPDDPALMAEGMARVLRDVELRNSLRAQAAKLAHACSWEQVGPQWLALYEQLICSARDTDARPGGARRGVHPVL